MCTSLLIYSYLYLCSLKVGERKPLLHSVGRLLHPLTNLRCGEMGCKPGLSLSLMNVLRVSWGTYISNWHFSSAFSSVCLICLHGLCNLLSFPMWCWTNLPRLKPGSSKFYYVGASFFFGMGSAEYDFSVIFLLSWKLDVQCMVWRNEVPKIKLEHLKVLLNSNALI